jgi:predicted aspartyl protease
MVEMHSGLSVPYDLTYFPPAPVLAVTIQSPHDPNLSTTISAVIDTGSDITVMPDWLPVRLGLRPLREALIAGYDGSLRRVPVYRAHISIGRLILHNVRIVAIPTTESLLGRNVLNQLDLHLNGPQLVLEVMNA